MLNYLYRLETDNVEFEDFEGNVSTIFIFSLGFCKQMQMTPKNLDNMRINIAISENDESYKIIVSDSDTDNSFQISRMTGDLILYDTKQGKRYVDYDIKIKVLHLC